MFFFKKKNNNYKHIEIDLNVENSISLTELLERLNRIDGYIIKVRNKIKMRQEQLQQEKERYLSDKKLINTGLQFYNLQEKGFKA